MIEKVREKTLEEMERVICVREHLRAFWRTHPAGGPVEENQRVNSLAQVNEVILLCKEGILNNSAGQMAKALELTQRTP